MSTETSSAEPIPNISKYETLELAVPKPFVYHVQLLRPQKFNAMNKTMWLLVVLFLLIYCLFNYFYNGNADFLSNVNILYICLQLFNIQLSLGIILFMKIFSYFWNYRTML